MTATQNGNESWGVWTTIIFVLLLLSMFLVGLIFPWGIWSWIAVLVLLIVTVMFIGRHKNGLYYGLVVDERNKISLSRLQVVCWTVLILSAFITAGTGNMRTYFEAYQLMEASRGNGSQESAAEPLDFPAALEKVVGEDIAGEIQFEEGQTLEEISLLEAFGSSLSIVIPSELWLLMGISTTTLVGSPLIRSNKTKKTPGEGIEQVVEYEAAIDAQAQRQGVSPDEVGVQGQVLVNKDPIQARFGDLFETEYVGNVSQLDIAKVQNFYFTAILVLSYAALLGLTFSSINVVTEMPALSSSVLALLGISSAGYLAGKAVPTNISAKAVQNGSGQAPEFGGLESMASGRRIVNVEARKFQDGLMVNVTRIGGTERDTPETAELVGEVRAGSYFFKFDPSKDDNIPWEIMVQEPGEE